MWGLILLGLVNMGGFSATFFVPYAVESVFGLNAQSIGRHYQFQLPVRHLPQSRCRVAVRSLFPLEHYGRSGGPADSRQLRRPLP